MPDREILVGTALPAAGLALAQCVLLVVAGVAFLRLGVPERPELLVSGVVLGMVLLTALAAVTSAVTRTVESAQITTMSPRRPRAPRPSPWRGRTGPTWQS